MQESHEDDEKLVDRKRSRRAEWPLKVPEVVIEKQPIPAPPTKPLKRSPSPSPKQNDVASKRPSKFLEGSMHDRTSNKPPSVYTREEDAREHYLTQERPAMPAQNRHASLDGIGAYYDAGIESSKSSSMYRFGRAIVNVFKPVSGWRGFGGGKEQPVNTEKSVMQARQVRAEKEYAELKKNGFVGTQPTLAVPRMTTVPAIRYEDTLEEARSAPYRDSGIDMDSSRSSSERKSDGQVSQPDAGLVGPLLSAICRVPSPLSETSSPRKSSVQFRKPSFQTLKKVQSHIQLPTAKRPIAPAFDSSIEYDKPQEATSSEQTVRKQPSRKEIVKQQRLSKKVSDLENQLDIARRNLKLSLNDDSITPSADLHTGVKTFVPGALPSLPSERALKTYINPEKGENSGATDSKQPLATFSEGQNAARESDIVMADPTTQLNQELQISVFTQNESQPPRSKQPESKKRKSDARGDEGMGRNLDQGGDEGESDSGKKPKLRRSMRQSPKTQKAIDADVGGRRKQNLNPRTPRNSPLKHVEPVPPLPVALDFDPAKVDQAKIMSMRSTCTEKTPFGKHPEDIVNLRKDFPNIGVPQLADYIGSVSEHSKVTDHTSLSHHNQPAAPVLGPPCSTSPTKAKLLKGSDRPTSTMPGHEFPGLSSRIEGGVKASMNGVVNAGSLPEAENLPVSKSASTLRIKALHASAAKNEKPLPGIQKEEYEWPEDVF